MSIYPVILAVDFGTKRVGVAISRGSLAEPLVIIPNSPTLLTQLKEILTQEKVEKLVVGLSENTMAELTRHFVTQLQTVTDLPIELVDETLSSHTAARKLRESGASLRVRQQPLDDRAAAEFLQEYLDGIS